LETVSKIKLSAVVVTYYPNLSDLILNIKQYIQYIDKLIIWENTPDPEKESYKVVLPEYSDKIIYLGQSENKGMAYALNRCVEWSLDNGFSHILTMDQDSYWGDFKYYKKKIIQYSIDKSIGIFGPNVYTERSVRTFNEIEIVDDIITSGAVYDLNIFIKIGMFREDFFIDAVDIEFCCWASRYGFKTALLGDCYLKQQYGNSTTHYFFKKSLSTYNYPPIRLFRIVKNHIILWIEYPELSRSQKKLILTEYNFIRIVKIVLYESNKIKKIISIIKGTLYGLLKIGVKSRKKIDQ
jgi:rhamnosyltransferase